MGWRRGALCCVSDEVCQDVLQKTMKSPPALASVGGEGHEGWLGVWLRGSVNLADRKSLVGFCNTNATHSHLKKKKPPLQGLSEIKNQEEMPFRQYR
jgi:hypothetical protein